jgi:hypothetical protein
MGAPCAQYRLGRRRAHGLMGKRGSINRQGSRRPAEQGYQPVLADIADAAD